MKLPRVNFFRLHLSEPRRSFGVLLSLVVVGTLPCRAVDENRQEEVPQSESNPRKSSVASNSGAPLLRLELFEKTATFLARHRLLRKNSEGDGWRFRHDKILDWFLRPVMSGT